MSFKTAVGIEKEPFSVFRTAESYREIEFRAAILIQSWFRGLRTRQYLKLV